MFREMRRKAQQLSRRETERVLREGSSGVLALAGDGGYPYALPISYVYHQGCLYFHCAPLGHKLDAIAVNPKASFCVIDEDQVMPELYTTGYRSAIAFGRVRRLEDEGEMRAALAALCRKYAPEIDPMETINKSLKKVCVLEMSIEHLSGKEGLELLRRRKKEEGRWTAAESSDSRRK